MKCPSCGREPEQYGTPAPGTNISQAWATPLCQCENPLIECGAAGCRCKLCGEPARTIGMDWKLSDDAKARIAEIESHIVKPGDPRLDQIVGGPQPHQSSTARGEEPASIARIRAAVNDTDLDMEFGDCDPAEDVKVLLAAYDKLLALCAAPVSAWQDVETAPMDVEVLVGWWANWPELHFEMASGLYGSTRGGWLHGQAKFWQPLPAPPAPPRNERVPPAQEGAK